MKTKLLPKVITIILIIVIFYCIFTNYNVLQEGYDAPPNKCSDIKNCTDCGTKVTSDGVCYWCNGLCESGANYNKYTDGQCNRDINKCTASGSSSGSASGSSSGSASGAATAPVYPILVDVPPGTKMSLQHQ